jgi:hypothetical protein
MEYNNPKTANPISGVEHLADLDRIMSLFEEIWPKILFFDPDVKPYYNLMQNVYAQGMINALEVVKEKLEVTTDATIH